jgi:NAD(P)-dependent dehydrogenase (short-subunit alcohol dehydrogenase family)
MLGEENMGWYVGALGLNLDRVGASRYLLSPGLVYSPMVAPRMDDDLRQIRRNASPLGTEGDSWDIGYAALYLASEEARWVSGITLPVDAGLSSLSPVTYQTLGQQRY